MSDQSKIEILKAISNDAVPGKAERFSFNTVAKKVGLRKDEVDEYLTTLNKHRYVGQYAKKGVDSFMVEIKQKGLDAIADGNFI